MSNVVLSNELERESLLARYKVLRQTYILLSANVLFSALCAWLGMVLNVGSFNPILSLVIFMGLIFGVNATKNSGLGIVLLFALTGFLGFSVSALLNMFFHIGASGIVYKALLGTAIIFFSLSFYVLKTGTNFTFLGGFLFVAMMVIFLASLAGMFFGATKLQLFISAAAVLIFSGYILYDTSNIIHGEETNYIMATLNLFLNIFNIFIHLLNLLAAFSNDR